MPVTPSSHSLGALGSANTVCSSVFAGTPAGLEGRSAHSTLPDEGRLCILARGVEQPTRDPAHSCWVLALFLLLVFTTFESFPKPGLDVPGATCCPLLAFCYITSGVCADPVSSQRGRAGAPRGPGAVCSLVGPTTTSLETMPRPVWVSTLPQPQPPADPCCVQRGDPGHAL